MSLGAHAGATELDPARLPRCVLCAPLHSTRPSIMFALIVATTALTDPRHAPFLSWLNRCGAQIGPVSLGKSSSGAGYGAFATEAIEENEELFTIPSLACVSLYDACGDAECGESFAKLIATGQGGATVAVAGLVAKEWLCTRDAGPRGPYLSMLPWDAEWPPEGEQEQEHILWWSEAQIDDLDGSEAYSDAVDIRDEVNTAVKVIKSLIGASVRKAYKERGEPIWNVLKADEDIDKAVRGAFVSILTRSFSQEQDGDEEKRLVPLLDMLQHASEPNIRHVAVLDEATGEQKVVVTARRRIEAGEELLNCYDGGELPPARFLTRFGFVPGQTVGGFVDSLNEGKIKLPFGLKFG